MEERVSRKDVRRQKFTVTKRRYSWVNRLNWFFWVMIMISSAIIGVALHYSKWLNVWVIGYLVSIVILTFVAVLLKKVRWLVLMFQLVVVTSHVVVMYKGYTIFKTYQQLEQVQVPMTKTYRLLVLNDSSIAAVGQVENDLIYVPIEQGGKAISDFHKNVQDNTNVSLKLQNTPSYLSAYQELMGGKVRAIVMDSAYETLIEQIYPEYSVTVKSIYNFDVKENNVMPSTLTQGGFNVLVSAVDSFQSVENYGRTDVSLLLSVNEKTNKVVMTQSPIMAYTTITQADKTQQDVLGTDFVYGANHAMATAKALYDTPVDYYVRIHLEKLAQLVKLLGDIQVNNKVPFTTQYGGYTYQEGVITLDYLKTIGFIRENVVVNGVSQKENNQLEVLRAVIQKLGTFAVIRDTPLYMKHLQSALYTNMPFKQLMTLLSVLVQSSSTLQQRLEVTMKNDVPSGVFEGIMQTVGEIDTTQLNRIRQVIKQIISE